MLNDVISIENNIIDSAETEMEALIAMATLPFSKHLDAMYQVPMDVAKAIIKVQEVCDGFPSCSSSYFDSIAFCCYRQHSF